MKNLVTIAFTHNNLAVGELGALHIAAEERSERLNAWKSTQQFEEVMYLSTCNRVEFVLVTRQVRSLADMLSVLFPALEREQLERLSASAEVHYGEEAVRHLFRVAGSLDSMVIGEREIIAQVRTAYEQCRDWGLTGDNLRLLMRKTIEVAKHIFTATDIFKKPVSVVALAYHKLRDMNIKSDARILFIGAGQTNRTMVRFLTKHGYRNVVVFNRTLQRAEALAAECGVRAQPLEALNLHTAGFDVLITCTGSDAPVVTKPVYQHLLQGDTHPKVVIDLAVPSDLDPCIAQEFPVKLIDVAMLQEISRANQALRAREVNQCEAIIEEALTDFRTWVRTREVERAMSGIPQAVKAIRSTALEAVFARDTEQLDATSRETLLKVVDYLEKKYISVPMKMAREILVDTMPGAAAGRHSEPTQPV